MKLYNTLGRELQDFAPSGPLVKIYTCGPTVYDYQHIGNFSGYIYWDVLIRLINAKGWDVKRIMNITDVGHLVSDADEGEDKLEKGSAREGKSAQAVADFYTADFKKSMEQLNLLKPEYARATDFIPEQIEIIKTLLEKDFAYKTEQAIYFDTEKLSDYGKLTGQNLADKEVGARREVVTDSAKRHPQDFALWFFTVGRFANHQMRWPSDLGEGFPGWHIECSAIVHALLGEPIDIHTGGVDHIGTHHTNEIAQSESAFGKPLSRFWLHNNHMMVDAQKISKSLGNGYALEDLAKKGFSAMDFKLLVLQSHYRSQSNFSWGSLSAAQARLKRFYNFAALRFQSGNSNQAPAGAYPKILTALGSDLDTPGALAAIEEYIESIENQDLSDQKPAIESAVTQIDQLFGLDLMSQPDISSDQKQVIAERTAARDAQDWAKSDQLRDQLGEQGIGLRDTDNGPIWYRL